VNVTELVDALERLLMAYGPRGWWPLPSRAGMDGRDADGYLRGPSIPVAGDDDSATAARFEIAVASVLAQNTAWNGAGKALASLGSAGLLSPSALAAADDRELFGAIKPAGTFRRKAGYLRALAVAWQALDGETPTRGQLLGIPGIGFETADCIMVYCFGAPAFIADAYARRILARIGLTETGGGYESVRAWAEARLPRDAAWLAEAHALIVEHAKRHCRARPACDRCPLVTGCAYALNQLE